MKRDLLTVGLLAVLALASAEARAQNGTARGNVIDEQGAPVADAKVVIEFQGGVTRRFETKTTKKGEYVQVGLPPGIYRFTVSKDGYQRTYVESRVNLGDPTVMPEVKLVRPPAATGGIGDAQGGAGDFAVTFNAASALANAGKLDEAEAAFKEILAKNPSVAETHFNLGFIAFVRKDWPAAQAEYQKATELKPTHGDAWVGLARTYLELDQKDKAMEVMKLAGAANENDPVVQFNLGIFYLNAQQLDDAEATFKKVQSLAPSNAEVDYYLGTIAINKGKTADCIAHLEKYLASSPTNASNVATAQGLIAALKPKK